MWVCEEGDFLRARANTVSAQATGPGSTRVNALWRELPGLDLAAPGKQYFELTVEDGAPPGVVWFGLGSEAHFGAGWKCKALSYGGNLSDGGGLLRQRFGPQLAAGDVVGLRAEVRPAGAAGGMALSVHLRVNGKPLGAAFQLERVDALAAALGPLFPVVSFSAAPAAATLVRDSVPDVVEFLPPAHPEPRTGPGGMWVAPAEAILGAPCPALPQVVFNLDDQSWALSARVGNSLFTQLSPEPPHAGTGQAAGTRMMPPPELQPLESAVEALLSSVTSVEFEARGAGALVLVHDAGALTMTPHEQVLAPVRTSEVRWMQL